MIPGGAPATPDGNDGPLIQARIDMERWIDEGGNVPSEAAALLRATTNRR